MGNPNCIDVVHFLGDPHNRVHLKLEEVYIVKNSRAALAKAIMTVLHQEEHASIRRGTVDL